MRLPALALLLAGMPAAAGCATDPPPPAPAWKPVPAEAFARPLRLGDCLDLAWRGDVQAARWRARLGTARAELAAAKTVPNPLLSLSLDDIALRDASGSLANQTLSLAYPLLSFWTRPPRVAAAEARVRAEEESVRGDRRELAAEVGREYFRLVADGRRVAVLATGVGTAREGLRLAVRRRELGEASPLEEERARAEVLRAEGEWADAEADRRLDALAFAFALGAGEPVLAAVTDEEPAWDPVSDPGSATDCPLAILEEAARSDPAVAQARAAREAAEADWEAEQRASFPLGDAQFSAGVKRAPEGTGAAASAEVPLPVFDRNQAGISKAGAALLAARADEEAARRASARGVSLAWERVRAAAVRLSRAGPIAAALARSEEAALRGFQGGDGGYEEVLAARRDRTAAGVEESASWMEWVSARWEVECSAGRHDPARIGSGPGRDGRDADPGH